MKYWHMQLHPGDFQDWNTEEIREIVNQGMIGCSGEPVSKFYEIKSGDIVLVRHGGDVLNLVKVLENPAKMDDSQKTSTLWFDHFAKVEILGSYDNMPVSGEGWFLPKTLMAIARENAIAYGLVSRLLREANIKIEMTNLSDILHYKKQIILQGPPGTGKTKLAKELAERMVGSNPASTGSNGTLSEATICDFMKPGLEIESATKYTSYTVKEWDQTGVSVQLKSTGSVYKPSYQNIIRAYQTKLWQGGQRNGNDPYAAAIAKYIFEQQGSPAFEAQDQKVHLIQFHPSYTYEDFVRGITAKPSEGGNGILYEAEDKLLSDLARRAVANPKSSYVLIIDEINRANLSSVLGELIYALEYRDEAVDSMYAVDGNNKLRLPSNLYIIGTMNTADRSVGHIDYAIRRRFAFVDVLPQALQDDDKIWFNTKGFEGVKALFNSGNVSSEFDAKDVQIGHSYFIAKKSDAPTKAESDAIFAMKMEYEVVPILREYVRDGILTGQIGNETVDDYIKGLTEKK